MTRRGQTTSIGHSYRKELTMVLVIKIWGIPQLTPDQRLNTIEEEIVAAIRSTDGLNRNNLESSSFVVHFLSDLRTTITASRITVEISGWIMEDSFCRRSCWDDVLGSVIGKILAKSFPETTILCLPTFDKWNSIRHVWNSAEKGCWIRLEQLKPGLLLKDQFSRWYEFVGLSGREHCLVYPIINQNFNHKGNEPDRLPVTIEDGVVFFGDGFTRLDRPTPSEV